MRVKNRFVRLFMCPILFIATVNLFSGCAHFEPRLPEVEQDLVLAKASLTTQDGLNVVKLKGDPYSIGYQHGYFLRKEIFEQWAQIMAFARSQLPIPYVSDFYINWKLFWAYRKMAPHITPDYKEEMRGLAAGSQMPIHIVHWAHAIPDLYPTLCANGVYLGRAVSDGKLYHLRNLDWSRGMRIHERPCVFVIHPKGKNSFVNVGYVGFIGVLTGINAKGISVGQIGGDTIDYTLRGEPMPFILRRVLEDSSTLESAAELVKNAKRTYGYNYVFADSFKKDAIALETTAQHFAVFSLNDPREEQTGYAIILDDVLIRADTAFDAKIRSLQTASGGNPETPELEPPTGKAYEVRYKKQAQLAQQSYSKIDALKLMEIAREIAPPSNLQSVIFAFPEMWVANAHGDSTAPASGYHHMNVIDLLEDN